MSLMESEPRIELPKSLESQLRQFQRLVWNIKLLEATGIAVFGLFVTYLAVFLLDRWGETSGAIRGVFLLLALLLAGGIPWAIYRWVWRHRRFEHVARLLSRKMPRIGDQLLGVIELVRNEREQARSPALCAAAVRQAGIDAAKRDFRQGLPAAFPRFWWISALIPVALACGVYGWSARAAENAWVRFFTPWGSTPRYTFANFEMLPDPLIVAHGEPLSIVVKMQSESRWKPETGTLRLRNLPAAVSHVQQGVFKFELPPQIDSGLVRIQVGDSFQRVKLVPTIRPELASLTADYLLPDYLGRKEREQRDARSGSITLVKGSRVRLKLDVSRPLESATINGRAIVPQGSTLQSEAVEILESLEWKIDWRDQFGLTNREPFQLSLTARDDDAPTVTCEDLQRQKVLLHSEQLDFIIHAQDDFGVKQVGLEWNGLKEDGTSGEKIGERVLSLGGVDQETLELKGTFSASALEIDPQSIQMRVFVEDYLPGRARAYSVPYTFFILTADEHAIWLTEQFNKWHRQSLEVRDRELQLHEVNKQLRRLTTEELDRPENRRKLEQQAEAERANGRRLSGLVQGGEDLVRQAARNPEFGVGHLEKWAEMLQILKDISGNRMPSVADLLKEGAQSPVTGRQSASPDSKVAGQIRPTPAGQPESHQDNKKATTPVPSVVDVESSQGVPKQQPPTTQEEPSASKSTGGKFGLPTTMVADTNDTRPPATPAEEKVDQAIQQQKELLAEFDKVSEELETVLANLEGSTLVKRLKSAARKQYKIGGQISELVGDTFGMDSKAIAEPSDKLLKGIAEEEAKASLDVSYIMDDLQAYLERRQLVRFQSVLEEMRKQDAIAGLRQLGNDLRKESGLSMAQTEFWSDTLDRWGDDLVDPACAGKCPGCKSKGSLPPSLVLEVLQILESEVNLREETRVTQQARSAVQAEEHMQQAQKLSTVQQELRQRINVVIEKIEELPDAEEDFGKELRLLGLVAGVMGEAAEILAQPETGNPAIAAETEAIELLLQSKKFNPRSRGGGGGSTPGGGGGGTTSDSALALIGTGVNQKEVREDHKIQQATGETGTTLPEEFRVGLDEYFIRLERGSQGKTDHEK